MELVIACGALALAALLYTFWLSPEPVRAKTPAEREQDYFQEKRETLYENLRDLHLEYRMGKLSDQDYEQMKRAYQAEMAALLAEMEARGATAPAEEMSRAVPGRCAQCGKDNPVENRFCGACGAELPRAQGNE